MMRSTTTACFLDSRQVVFIVVKTIRARIKFWTSHGILAIPCTGIVGLCRPVGLIRSKKLFFLYMRREQRNQVRFIKPIYDEAVL